MQVLLELRVTFPVQFWHTLAAEQNAQLVIAQLMQVPFNSVVLTGQTQNPLTIENEGSVHPQILPDNVKFPTQV